MHTTNTEHNTAAVVHFGHYKAQGYSVVKLGHSQPDWYLSAIFSKPPRPCYSNPI